MRLPDRTGFALAVLWVFHRLGLPSGWAHRLVYRGAIGRSFSLGRGACIVGRNVKVGTRVRVGRGSSITCEHVELGDGVVIGENVTIRCRRLRLDTGVRIDGPTVIHGTTTPNSGLEMGERSWLFAHCHVSTDELVRIGARSAAGSHTLIFTHSSYLPITNGYPVTFAPVTIGAEVWLPWHVFILPGATIGDGATVGAMSLVSGTIPPRTLAVGVPAKVVKDEASYLRRHDTTQLEALGLKVLTDVIRNFASSFKPAHLFIPSTVRAEPLPQFSWKVSGPGGPLLVRWLGFTGERPAPVAPRGELLVTVGRDQAPDDGAWWIDLSTLRAQLPVPAPALLTNLLSQFSVFGIRFGWRHAVLTSNAGPIARSAVGQNDA